MSCKNDQAQPQRNNHSNGGLTQELQHCRTELERASSLLHTLVDNFPGGISILDERLNVVLVNERLKRLLELPDALFQKDIVNLEEILYYNAERGEYGPGDPAEQVAERMALARKRQPHSFEREREDGTVIEVRGIPLDNGGFVAIYLDITERHHSQARLVHMAHHDVLTDLPNRALLRTKLEEALAARKDNACVSLLMLDLDRFKEVNDTLGHPSGDALLKAVTERLYNCVREADVISRLGGDEFAILQAASEHLNAAEVLADRVVSTLSSPFELDGHQVHIGTSIGIAFAPFHGDTPDQLLKNADVALYRAKSDGRGRYCVFETGMDLYREKRMKLTRDLRQALKNDELTLYYQPLLDFESDKISGFEALIRWHHPVDGNISPEEFIPLAEENGMILKIGEWVLRQACREAVNWPSHLTIAVNVSPIQLRAPQFVDIVRHALGDARIQPERLELEITETAILGEEYGSAEVLKELRALGVRIALDDFGTGYSSLSHLRKFQFDKIKIDRSFIRDLSDSNADAVAVLRSLAQLGISLGLATTAEGVETKAQMDRVRAEGCTEMQGFYVHPPSPGPEISRLLGLMK